MSGFKIVSDVETQPGGAPPPVPAAAHDQQQRAARLMLTALAALSQRAVVAVAALFSLVLAASAFWLALVISTAPTNPQLICFGMYAVFVLALHWVKRVR